VSKPFYPVLLDLLVVAQAGRVELVDDVPSELAGCGDGPLSHKPIDIPPYGEDHGEGDQYRDHEGGEREPHNQHSVNRLLACHQVIHVLSSTHSQAIFVQTVCSVNAWGIFRNNYLS